jgi:hypothetical protein
LRTIVDELLRSKVGAESYLCLAGSLGVSAELPVVRPGILLLCELYFLYHILG